MLAWDWTWSGWVAVAAFGQIARRRYSRNPDLLPGPGSIQAQLGLGGAAAVRKTYERSQTPILTIAAGNTELEEGDVARQKCTCPVIADGNGSAYNVEVKVQTESEPQKAIASADLLSIRAPDRKELILRWAPSDLAPFLAVG